MALIFDVLSDERRVRTWVVPLSEHAGNKLGSLG